MRPRVLLPLVVVIVCILCTLPMVLIMAVRVEDSAVVSDVSSSEVAVVRESAAQGPVTAGVVMGGAAAAYGWDDLAATDAEFSDTVLHGNRVIIAANLNAGTDTNLPQIVQAMHDRGANPIFIAPDVLADADTPAIAAGFPDTTFVQNVAERGAVAQWLDVPPGVVNIATERDSGDGVRDAVAGMAVLVVLLGVGLWLALRVSKSSLRSREQAASGGLPFKAKRRSGGDYPMRRVEIEAQARGQMTDFTAYGDDVPLLHELSTYILADQQFDDSFPIERADGDFLGDCGLQISTYVNRYDPDKVTALRLWLFDAHDLRTASALLASEDAVTDAASRPKEPQASPPQLATPGAVVTLETGTLRLRAQVLAMRYGFADTLPQNSFFDHLVVEIAVFEKA